MICLFEYKGVQRTFSCSYQKLVATRNAEQVICVRPRGASEASLAPSLNIAADPCCQSAASETSNSSIFALRQRFRC